jgi:hypothetical protein
MNSTTQVPSQSILNPTQLYLLQLFASQRQEKEKEEVQALLLDYYRKKVDAATETLWQDHHLSDEKMEEMLHTHHRTPYK